ncbi:MAG: hypothetical protein JWN04_2705 [Myxococcaceae bacterium]|nr:hypothetical protein [Myxococcaceae bacterium]
MNAKDVDVFQYLDYRAFLRDYYLERKARRPGFSYRGFSRRAGLGSPNYLKLVIEGERSLTPAMAARFAKACGLADESAAFFEHLVAFNQAKSVREREDCFARLTGFRRHRSVRRLDLKHADYHSTWYLPAIRELAARADFREDPTWIARALAPRISVAQAREALKTLVELGLLAANDDGHLRQSEPLVSTGPEMHRAYVAKYHKMMMRRAAASISLFASEERDVSSLTLCLGRDGIERIKRRLRSLRRELLEMSELESDPEQVVQINFQAFPLSARREQEPTP